ncbi:RING-H2 finger protein ATL66-like [Phalaenopsis equestris]|uniref:RING-H2 finger protein ATL66-like n=1 Tax=Phalaenopsis equestris TaxID=78828 RepID=UPI0009E2E642|nr:RING-H2 finger protein ATL66-like [Phalaenopsis equestris]
MSSYSPQNGNQGQQWPFAYKGNSGSHMELIATITVVLVFILITFHLYIRYRRQSHVFITMESTTSRPTPLAAADAGGLDAAAIAALPTFIYHVSSATNEGTEECAVCLSVVQEGEKMRFLPHCKHVFHAECIDMWLHSHATCPVCRTRARPASMSELGGLLPAPLMPQRFGHGGGGRAAEEGGSEPAEVSRMENGPRRWASANGNCFVDLERQLI